MRAILGCIMALIICSGSAFAQIPVTAVGERAHIQVNGGAMVLTTGEDWSGASLGGSLLYNLHPKFSVFGGYDHGFPVNKVDGHLDLYRAVGSVELTPSAFVGFGYAWFSEDVKGGLVQFLVTRDVAPRVKLGGMYAHVFASDELDDFEYGKVFLNYHLFGK